MSVYWDVNNTTNRKMLLPNTTSYAVAVYGGNPIFIKETASDVLHRAIKSHLTHGELSIDRIREIEIVFISDLKDMTFFHYLNQPKSMICRKMIRRFFEVKGEDIIDFEYNWLPDCFWVKE